MCVKDSSVPELASDNHENGEGDHLPTEDVLAEAQGRDGDPPAAPCPPEPPPPQARAESPAGKETAGWAH